MYPPLHQLGYYPPTGRPMSGYQPGPGMPMMTGQPYYGQDPRMYPGGRQSPGAFAPPYGGAPGHQRPNYAQGYPPANYPPIRPSSSGPPAYRRANESPSSDFSQPYAFPKSNRYMDDDEEDDQDRYSEPADEEEGVDYSNQRYVDNDQDEYEEDEEDY